MRNLLLIAAVVSLPLAAAQRTPAVDPGIQKAIEDHYFKAHATGSGDPLKGMFIEEGRMMSVQDGQLRLRTSAEYIGGFQGKPAADEAQRKRKVLMTDVAGDTAIAKVELDYPDVLFTDYFSLLRIGGQWKIVHKTFHRQPKK